MKYERRRRPPSTINNDYVIKIRRPTPPRTLNLRPKQRGVN